MDLKLKVLGLSVLVMLAVAAIAASNASGTISGHFTQDVALSKITGEEIPGTPHRVLFSVDGGTPIQCTQAHYNNTPEPSLTFQRILMTVSYKGCYTFGTAQHDLTVHIEGCEYEFYSNSAASTHSPTGTATMGFVCGREYVHRYTHPNCTMQVPPQTWNGVTYTTTVIGGKHALTVNFKTESITVHYEAGICVFLGTTHTGKLEGAFVMRGLSPSNEPVNITAT